MSLLEHSEAQTLLDDATVSADAVRDCTDRLTGFLRRYLPRFYRTEQRQNATLVIRGLLSGLERKTCEPIAIEAGLARKPIQFFVGAGKWDDEAVMLELRAHVREELAAADGVVVVDPSGFPKKGTESCGVDRQWCGRLGKVDNCQIGVFLAYAAEAGYAPLDRQLYLPEDWANDEARREKGHVPSGVKFQETWRIALDLLDRSLPGLPHGWIVGDDELGWASQFRAALRQRTERYVLDVPCNTTVRDLERRRPPRKKAGVGRKREVALRRADIWAASQPESRWERITVRDGEKGPLVVDAMSVRVRAKEGGGADRAGGAAGGDPAGRRVADRLRPEQRRRRSPPGRSGSRPAATAPDRGGIRGRQGRSRAGSLRGPELGRMAPPYDALPGGVVVLVPGTTASRGGKPRRSQGPRRGRSSRGCSAVRRRAPRESPRRSRECCSVMRNRGFITGTRGRASFPRVVRKRIRVEQPSYC
jgi:hypothetical protein